MAQNQQDPLLRINLKASEVENVIAFLNRATLQGNESETHAHLKREIAGQAREQLEATQRPEIPPEDND